MNRRNKESAEQETYILYNMTITKIKMANSQYNEDTKEMCEVAVMGALSEAYQITDVYHQVLQFMRDNEIYERFLKPILELSLYPPQLKQKQNGQGRGEPSGGDKKENSTGNDSIKTKTDKYSEISQKFIQYMFKIDDDDL